MGDGTTLVNGVLYDGDHIQVLGRQGTSDYLVVSFGTKNEVANGASYWLKTVADRADLNVIGFMPRTQTWYPQQEVDEAVAVLAPMLDKYIRIIVAGTSMGGYAALKYSARLKASHVLSFAPQYSIDPTDVGSFDKRFIASFDPRLHAAMAITAADVGGEAYVFYDPYYAEDKENVHRIIEAAPRVHEVRLPRTTHFPIMLFRGTQPMTALLETCVKEGADAVRSAARRARWTSSHRIVASCAAYGRRNPERAMALFAARRPSVRDSDAQAFYLALAKQALATDKADFAAQVIETLLQTEPDNRQALLMASRIYLTQKHLAPAVARAKAAVACEPQDAETLNEAGFLLFQAGAVDDAEAAFAAAIPLVPENAGLLGPGILRRLSAVYLRKRQPDKALTPALEAIARAPRIAPYHSHLAEVLHQLGRHDEAAEAAQAALDLDPNDQNARMRLDRARQNLAQAPVRMAASS